MRNWTSTSLATDLVMPSLEELEREGALHFELLGVFNWFTGMGVPHVEGSHGQAHYKNFVRLVDTAVRRYESARRQLDRSINREPQTTGISDFVRCLSDLEAMFNLLHRALALLNRMKGAAEVPVEATDLQPFDADSVQRIRHASEHIDDLLRKGEIGKDDDVMLRVWREGITFAGEQISFITIATWLRRLHLIARRLIDHDSLADERPDASAST